MLHEVINWLAVHDVLVEKVENFVVLVVEDSLVKIETVDLLVDMIYLF